MYGPYGPDARGRYRIVKVGHEGGRSSATFRTLKAALAAKTKAEERLTLEGLTVSDVVDRFIAHRRAMGRKEATIERYEYAFRGMLWDVFDAPVAALTKGRAQKLYDARRAQVTDATQLQELKMVKSLFAWATKKALLQCSPFADIESLGTKSRGKPQLTTDEARVFLAYCLEQAPDPGAVGALMALGLGLRSGEARGVMPRDIDDNGAVLIVRAAKYGKVRRVGIPLEWRAALNKQTVPLGLTKNQLLDRVKAMCRTCGVLEVTPHGLRGTHSSVATAAGVAPEIVARSLGHSLQVNREHYTTPSAASNGLVTNVAAKLKLVR